MKLFGNVHPSDKFLYLKTLNQPIFILAVDLINYIDQMNKSNLPYFDSLILESKEVRDFANRENAIK